jgi:hypothetical protein
MRTIPAAALLQCISIVNSSFGFLVLEKVAGNLFGDDLCSIRE